MYIYICVYIYVRVHMYIYTYIHIYVYVYKHVYIYMYGPGFRVQGTPPPRPRCAIIPRQSLLGVSQRRLLLSFFWSRIRAKQEFVSKCISQIKRLLTSTIWCTLRMARVQTFMFWAEVFIMTCFVAARRQVGKYNRAASWALGVFWSVLQSTWGSMLKRRARKREPYARHLRFIVKSGAQAELHWRPLCIGMLLRHYHTQS